MASPDIDKFREETECFLEIGNKRVELMEDIEDATIVVGMSGAGKTTLTQVLFGNNEELWSYDTEGSGCLIRDESNRITEATLISCSSFPELIMDAETNSVVYDCPGFRDTRSASVEISSTRFLKKVVDNYKRIRIIAVINHQFVRIGSDRYGYSEFVKHLLDFIEDVSKFKLSLALVVSKVEINSSDEQIMNGVANFIDKAREELKKTRLHSRSVQIHELTEIFLQKTNDEYTNIGVFRRPTTEGRLRDLPEVQTSRLRLREMVLRNPSFQYQETLPSDLRYVLCTDARLVANELITGLARGAREGFAAIMNRFRNGYVEKMDGSNSLATIQETASRDLQSLASVINGLVDGQSHSDYGKFPRHQFKEASNALGIPLAAKDLKTLEDDMETLCFLEQMSTIQYGDSVTKNINDEIVEAFQGFSSTIESYSHWLSALQHVFTEITTNPVDPNLMKQASKLNLADSAVLSEDDIIKTELPEDIQQQFLGALPVGERKKLSLFKKLITLAAWDINGEGCAYDPTSQTIKITGHALSSSLVISCLEKHRGQGIRHVVVISTLFFYLDTDILTPEFSSLQGLNMILISPEVKAIGSRSISLNGKDGSIYESAAAKGQDGMPGHHGGNGGTFYGIILNLHGDVTITANGGRGGNGQDGGQGPDGMSSPSVISDDIQMTGIGTGITSRFVITGGTDGVYDVLSNECSVFSGKDGGAAGKGGKAGMIKLLFPVQPGTVTIESNDGAVGVGGQGGPPGAHGNRGQGLRVQVTPANTIEKSITKLKGGIRRLWGETRTTVYTENVPGFIQGLQNLELTCTAEGQAGTCGNNIVGQELETDSFDLKPILSASVNEYTAFANTHIDNPFLGSLLGFVNQLSNLCVI